MLKRFMKTGAAVVMAFAVLLCTSPNAAQAADTNMTVEVAATTLDVTVTGTAAITIDPNTGVVTTPSISITNNATAPISVVTSGLQADALGYFTLVAAADHVDWSALNKADSKDLAITLGLGAGWATTVAGSLATGTVGTLSGTIAPAGTGAVTVGSVSHGNAFDAISTSTFPISWTIALAE